MRPFPTFAAIVALATAATAEPLKVLIVDGQNNHKWDITTPVLKDALEGSGAFKVEVSTTPAKGAPQMPGNPGIRSSATTPPW
jgi:hypothetical protein